MNVIAVNCRFSRVTPVSQQNDPPQMARCAGLTSGVREPRRYRKCAPAIRVNVGCVLEQLSLDQTNGIRDFARTCPEPERL
jgi:hypothetical protein